MVWLLNGTAKNSDLKVIDPTGQKGGQQLLNEFVEQLALNLPKFMEASSKEKGPRTFTYYRRRRKAGTSGTSGTGII